MIEQAAAIREALRLLSGQEDNPEAFSSAMALLPAGGSACEDLVSRAVVILKAAVAGGRG